MDRSYVEETRSSGKDSSTEECKRKKDPQEDLECARKTVSRGSAADRYLYTD